MYVCCECCVLSGRGLCDELITRPEEFYRLWSDVVCDLETSSITCFDPFTGPSTDHKNSVVYKATICNAYRSALLNYLVKYFLNL
jgi:hypothetical protein